MTENLAGRGEGLAGLVAKWRNLAESAKYYKEEARRLRMELAAEKHAMTEYDLTKCAKELETALEAAARLPATSDPAIETLAKLYHAVSMTGFGHDVKAQKQRLADALKEAGTLLAESFPPDYAEACAIEGRGELAALATPSPQALQCCCNASWLDLDQRDCPIHGPAATQEQSAGSGATIENLAAQIDTLELTANSIWGIREVRQAIQALKAEVAKLPGSPRKVGEDGALREALERIDGKHLCQTCGHRRGEHAFDLVGEHFCEHDEGVGTDCCKCQDYVGVVPPSYAELVIVLRAALSLSSPIEPCPDCEEAAKHAYSDATTPGFFHSTCAKHRAPTPQASSEIRERLAAIPGDVDTLLSRIIYGESVEDVRRKVAGYLERALAPSRQGAAKRVEG